MDDEHAPVDDAERLQPLDLGLARAGKARIVGRVGKAGVGLEQRVVAVGERLETGDEFVGGIVEAAERRARAEAQIAGLGVALEHVRGAFERDIGRLDHAFGENAEHGLGQVEGRPRHDHANAGRHHAFDGGFGVVVAGIDEAGDAVPQKLGRRERRRHPHVVAFEGGLVGIHAVEQERLGVRFVGEPARELERGMQVAIDETRRRHRGAPIDAALCRVSGRQFRRLADRHDGAAVDGDRGIANDAAGAVHGDQPADIGDDEIDGLHERFPLLPSLRGAAAPRNRNPDAGAMASWIAGSPANARARNDALPVLSHIGEIIGDLQLDEDVVVG
jgi:hypothetical protein